MTRETTNGSARDGTNHDHQHAMGLQMEACLAEVAGASPAPDLADRIASALQDHELRTGSRRRWGWLAAALVLAGLGVLGGVAWMGNGGDGTAVAIQPDPEQQDPVRKKNEHEQEPIQDPDGARDRRIDQLIRELELPAKRDQAVRQLIGVGAPAVERLRAAVEAERARMRADVLSALASALGAVETAQAKRLAGLPADQPAIVIADYSDNALLIVGADGKELRRIDEVYGAWDAELLANGHLLVTEFSVSRVQEIDMNGKSIWKFEGLRNPYDADRLPNGNTLIADTFGSRVIEVAPDGKIVWTYDKNVRPFDADRLPNGNTLIADVLNDHVIEVTPDGKVVWDSGNMPNVHDADRLRNGNTLITLRTMNKVVEVDVDGKVVLEIDELTSPSDADRLPDGTTMVAENSQVRIFDRAGKPIWKKKVTWAVEANRY